MKHFLPAVLLVLSVPAPVLAAPPATFAEFILLIVLFLQRIFALLVAAAAVGVIYGVFVYFVNADNESKREQIKGFLLWAIIGLFVLASLWGILAVLSNTFGWGPAGIRVISPPV